MAKDWLLFGKFMLEYHITFLSWSNSIRRRCNE